MTKKNKLRVWLFLSLSLGATLLFVNLSSWQWGRYQAKLHYQGQRLPTQGSGSPLDLEHVLIQDLKLPIHGQVQGHFLHPRLHVVHSQCQGKRGTQVFVPFQLVASKRLLLIDLGLIEESACFTELSAEERTLEGQLNPMPQRFNLAQAVFKPQAPYQEVSTLHKPWLEQHFQQDFYPYVLQLPENHVLVGLYCPSARGLSPEKHLAYALQWAALALMSLLYSFVIFKSWGKIKPNL